MHKKIKQYFIKPETSILTVSEIKELQINVEYSYETLQNNNNVEFIVRMRLLCNTMNCFPCNISTHLIVDKNTVDGFRRKFSDSCNTKSDETEVFLEVKSLKFQYFQN